MPSIVIAHFSDTHGLPRKGVPEAADVIVHTGDLFPNRTRGKREIEIPYQTFWLNKVASVWRKWAGRRPLILVNGNHDFIDPVPILRQAGIMAVNVEGRVVDMFGFRFMGMPDIPRMDGEWNHEHYEDEIDEHFSTILSYGPDVIVAHCPPYGVLDKPSPYENVHIGSTSITKGLLYGRAPLAYLCGHCHEEGGRRALLEPRTVVSNAATTRNMIEVEKP